MGATSFHLVYGFRLMKFISGSFTSHGWKLFKAKRTSNTTKPFFGTSRQFMSARTRVIMATQNSQLSGGFVLHGGHLPLRLSYGVWIVLHWLAKWNLPSGSRAAAPVIALAPTKSTRTPSHHLAFHGIATILSG